MSLITGLTTGLLTGLNAGLNNFGLAGLSKLTDGAAIASAMGFANSPDNAWKGNAVVDANTIQGSDNLSAVGTLEYGITRAEYDDDLTRFTLSTTDKLQAGGTGVCDPGAVSFGFVYIGYTTSLSTGRTLFGKREGSGGFLGFELESLGSSIRLSYQDGNGFSSRSVSDSFSNTPMVLTAVMDFANNNFALYSNKGDSTGATPTQNDATNTATFSVGAARLNANNADWGLFAWWSGANAEGINSTHARALESYLGV